MLAPNELKAKAMIIGRQLERIAWYELTAEEAVNWCTARAAELGANENEAKYIAYMAMHFVAAGH